MRLSILNTLPQLLGVLFCAGLVIGVSLSSNAQHPLTTELEALSARYANAKHLSFQVNYQLFASTDANQPVEELEGTIRKSGQAMAQKLGPIETLQTETYFLRVDHDDQQVLLLDRKMKDKTMGLFPTPPLDSLLEKYGAVERSETTDGQLKYAFQEVPGDPRFTGFDIYVNPLTGFISKLTFHFRDGKVLDDLTTEALPRLEITYSNYSESAINPTELDRSRYLRRQQKQWELLPAYANYQFQYQPF